MNQNKPVKLIVIDPDFGFFSAHAVLAYDVLEEGNNVIIKLYGPNRPKEEQWIELACNEFGNLEIVNDVYPVDGFDIARFASEDGPTSLDWDKIVEYIDTLIKKILERLKEEFGKTLWLMLHSPAQLHIYNPHGDHVGITPEGEEVEFDALYCIDSKGTQYCIIPNPDAENYGIEVFGTDHGEFTLTVSSRFEEVTTNEEVVLGGIQPDVTYYYDVDLADDGTFTILDTTPNEGIPIWIMGVVVATIAIAIVTVIVWRKRSSERAK